ncbi:co-chaperone DjlA [Legionella sp. MW5194]|uniref:co-chaperone DjlA n=1 Tax=Legionella sp. MW5194 TaxID=2662448 RepID=UPI00193CE086|nr:co-chaperone DjlA [Legionella sp. MW5194]QRN03176.1 co-chaperone DjlA [Legionella sp. MW5194]
MNFRQFFTTHTWWGKILGAFFGYQIAGPVGAFLGILIGNVFDRGLVEHFSRPHWRYHEEKRQAVQKVFFETTFLVMGHIAKSDGRVSEREIAMARTLMDEMRLGYEQRALAKRFFREGKQPDFDLGRTLNSLQLTCRDNPELLKLFMDIQYRAAMTDGLSPPKIKALDMVFSRLGFAPLHKQYRFYEDFGAQATRSYSYSGANAGSNQSGPSGSNGHSSRNRQSYNRHYSGRQQSSYAPQNNLTLAYALLEVSPQASKQDIKRAYRRLISRNHPDKLIAKGLPEEMIKMANDKTQKITKAYELICESKGW